LGGGGDGLCVPCVVYGTKNYKDVKRVDIMTPSRVRCILLERLGKGEKAASRHVCVVGFWGGVGLFDLLWLGSWWWFGRGSMEGGFFCDGGVCWVGV